MGQKSTNGKLFLLLPRLAISLISLSWGISIILRIFLFTPTTNGWDELAGAFHLSSCQHIKCTLRSGGSEHAWVSKLTTIHLANEFFSPSLHVSNFPKSLTAAQSVAKLTKLFVWLGRVYDSCRWCHEEEPSLYFKWSDFIRVMKRLWHFSNKITKRYSFKNSVLYFVIIMYEQRP